MAHKNRDKNSNYRLLKSGFSFFPPKTLLFDLILAGNLHVELGEIWKNDRLSPNAVFCRCRGLSSLPPPGLFAVFAPLVLLGLIFCRVFLGFCSLAQFFSASGDIDEERLSGERSGERLMNVNISNPISSQSEVKYDRCLSLYRLTSIFFRYVPLLKTTATRKRFYCLLVLKEFLDIAASLSFL